MDDNSRQAVYGIIFSEDRQKVLLIQRRDIPVWVIPGGGKESKETKEEAVVREVEEETGLKVRIVRQIAEYLPVNKLTQLSHFYECAIIDGKEKTGEETLAIRYYSINNLPKLLPPPYTSWIKDAAANHPQILRKKIEGVSYLVLLKLFVLHPILVFRFLLTKIGIHINSKG